MRLFKQFACIIAILGSCPVSATTLGQIMIADPNLGSRVLVYEQINNYAVVEGDIFNWQDEHLRANKAR